MALWVATKPASKCLPLWSAAVREYIRSTDLLLSEAQEVSQARTRYKTGELVPPFSMCRLLPLTNADADELSYRRPCRMVVLNKLVSRSDSCYLMVTAHSSRAMGSTKFTTKLASICCTTVVHKLANDS